MNIFCMGCDKPMIIEEDDAEFATARCPDCGAMVSGFDTQNPHLQAIDMFPLTREEIVEQAERLLGVRYVKEKFIKAKGPMTGMIYEAGAEVLRKKGVGDYVPPRVEQVMQRALIGLKQHEMFK